MNQALNVRGFHIPRENNIFGVESIKHPFEKTPESDSPCYRVVNLILMIFAVPFCQKLNVLFVFVGPVF